MSDVQLGKKANGRYEVRWREGGQRHGRTFDRKKDADAFATALRRAQQLGHTIDLKRGTETLGEFVEGWWETFAIPNLAPNTRKNYLSVYGNHIDPWLGGYALRDLTPAVVEDYRAQLSARGVGDPVARKALSILQRILRSAVVRGRIDANPVPVVKKPRQRRSRTPRPLAPEAIERICRQLPGHRDRTLVAVMAYGGLRPEEALHLKWQDVGPKQLSVFASKTQRARRVDLLAPLTKTLSEWKMKSGRPPLNRPVFSRADGEFWTDEDYRNWRSRRWGPATDRTIGRRTAAEARKDPAAKQERKDTAGLVPYDLRHSFASLLLWSGRSLPYVAAQMGHSVETCSTHYAAVLEELEAEGMHRVAADMAILRARRAVWHGRSVDAQAGATLPGA